MLRAAMQRLNELLTEHTPMAIRLHPDDKRTFEQALGQATAGQAVLRYYPPQLLRISGEAYTLCTVDFASRSSDDAMDHAGNFINAIATTSRAPNGVLTPRSAPIPEATYHRVSVSFTLHVPLPEPEPEGS